MLTAEQRRDNSAWGVLVKWPDMKRSQWLTPDGHLTMRKVHASRNYGDEGHAKCERVAKEITENHRGVSACAACL
jgi:hypothetical protein